MYPRLCGRRPVLVTVTLNLNAFSFRRQPGGVGHYFSEGNSKAWRISPERALLRRHVLAKGGPRRHQLAEEVHSVDAVREGCGRTSPGVCAARCLPRRRHARRIDSAARHLLQKSRGDGAAAALRRVLQVPGDALVVRRARRHAVRPVPLATWTGAGHRLLDREVLVIRGGGQCSHPRGRMARRHLILRRRLLCSGSALSARSATRAVHPPDRCPPPRPGPPAAARP